MKKTFTTPIGWDNVVAAVPGARGIAWDTCHKIYVLLDDGEVDLMREIGYDPLISSAEADPEQMLATLQDWYERSCPLRFINSVATNHNDPNAGFTTLVAQSFSGDDDDWGDDD